MIPTEVIELARALYNDQGLDSNFDALTESSKTAWIKKAYRVTDVLRARGVSITM